MPSQSSLKRTIQRSRNRNHRPLPLPLTLDDLVIPERYTLTTKGAEFLLHDSGPGADRILIFATRGNIQLLSRSSHWYGDGTFKTVPALFGQMYTIHGIQNGNSIPAVYALLPNKQEATYRRFFSEIKALQPDLHPATILTDFEHAAINSFVSEFPEARQRGCFFHLGQCFWRRIQQVGLQQRYENDFDFALQARMLPALAYVPQDHVVRAFEILTAGHLLSAELDPLVDYMEDTWIGRLRGPLRRQPPFPAPLWNCYDAVKDGLAKTNNACEGWHRGFHQLVGCDHPSIWKFIECLQKDQNLNEMKIEQFTAGQLPAPPKKKYRDCAERIQRIVGRFNNEWLNQGQENSLFDYLRGLAHNYNF